MKTLAQDIRRWERELRDLKKEGSPTARVEALLERLYLRAAEELL